MKRSIIHVILLPILLASATLFLAWSMMLPPDDELIAENPYATPIPKRTASVKATSLPVATPSKIPSTPEATQTSTSSANSAASSTPAPTSTSAPTTKTTPKPVVVKTPEAKKTPDPKKSPQAKPTPTPSPSELPAFAIAATVPEDVLKEAKIKAGRVDPFHTLVPPDIPDFKSELSIAKLDLNEVKKVGDIEPPPEPSIADGIVLKGIVNGGTDPIAIIEVDESSQLIRPGEYIRKSILVSTINASGGYIMLSKGSEKARVFLPEEE